ncbi:MAG TPA: hypothetical protein VJT72_15140 [Pseudonocardiaceae bacterium]|nr:hypothetical protein [Pseudonocardiaceae bacterium]
MADFWNPTGAARRRAYNAVWETDPVLAGPQIAPLVGPHNVSEELFARPAIDRILALT